MMSEMQTGLIFRVECHEMTGSANEKNKSLGVISINPPSAGRIWENLTKFSVRIAITRVHAVKTRNCRIIKAEINYVIK
jgi:hypothetical protein